MFGRKLRETLREPVWAIDLFLPGMPVQFTHGTGAGVGRTAIAELNAGGPSGSGKRPPRGVLRCWDRLHSTPWRSQAGAGLAGNALGRRVGRLGGARLETREHRQSRGGGHRRVARTHALVGRQGLSAGGGAASWRGRSLRVAARI
jgi:hypothetical protein